MSLMLATLRRQEDIRNVVCSAFVLISRVTVLFLFRTPTRLLPPRKPNPYANPIQNPYAKFLTARNQIVAAVSPLQGILGTVLNTLLLQTLSHQQAAVAAVCNLHLIDFNDRR